MKILLVAGHGGTPYDCGAVGCGCKEAELTREMVKLIKAKLVNYATVEIADTSKNWFNYICKQGKSFNFKAYDYVLEIHFNACVNDTVGNGITTGTEIYVTTSEKGTSVEQAIVNNISALGLRNRGVKRYNWGLISYVKRQGVSSALLETCFIDDVDDMKIYKAKKDSIAQAVVNGIVSGFKLKTTETTTKTTTKTTTITTNTAITNNSFRVKVIASALNIRKGAGTDYDITGVIKDNGTYTIVDTKGTVGKSGSWGKLKSGAGWISLNSKYVKKV